MKREEAIFFALPKPCWRANTLIIRHLPRLISNHSHISFISRDWASAAVSQYRSTSLTLSGKPKPRAAASNQSVTSPGPLGRHAAGVPWHMLGNSMQGKPLHKTVLCQWHAHSRARASHAVKRRRRHSLWGWQTGNEEIWVTMSGGEKGRFPSALKCVQEETHISKLSQRFTYSSSTPFSVCSHNKKFFGPVVLKVRGKLESNKMMHRPAFPAKH